MRDWLNVLIKGSSIYIYDILIVATLGYVIYVIPNLLVYLENNFSGNDGGAEFFKYIYPIVDLLVEGILDVLIS